ncbi:MAG: aldose 1-epimerase family protein [Planctomycetota bacterium]
MAKNDLPWTGKVINNAQIGGIETSVLDNGMGKGTRIAWINTGSGLRYKVVIDRGLDIAEAFFNQHSLAWLSHSGVCAPTAAANRGLDWLYQFAGGLLTTCGLRHTGGPEEFAGESHGLHGRISNIPAEIESVIQPDPINGRMGMSITGIMRESRVFGPQLELRRTICGIVGEPIIKICDIVTNCANSVTPHMMLYHCNFGWPLLDEGADIVWKGKWQSRGGDQDGQIFNSRHNFRKCQGPLDTHRGSGESVGFIDVEEDRAGFATVGLCNRKLSIAVEIRYKKKQLPCLTNWQHWGRGEYVTGIEPGTNPPIGQTKAKETGELIMLKPGQNRRYELELKILTQNKDIEAFLKKAGPG